MTVAMDCGQVVVHVDVYDLGGGEFLPFYATDSPNDRQIAYY